MSPRRTGMLVAAVIVSMFSAALIAIGGVEPIIVQEPLFWLIMISLASVATSLWIGFIQTGVGERLEQQAADQFAQLTALVAKVSEDIEVYADARETSGYVRGARNRAAALHAVE